MELFTRGKENRPAVLLMLPEGSDPEAVLAALKGLEKDYCLLLPVIKGPADLAALERRLVRDWAGRLWGAYGLRAGATALLELLGRGGVSVRTLILEGGFVPASAPPAAERVICWKGSRDKDAQKAWKALRDQTAPVGSLTMKKLTREQEFLTLRPDLMVKQIKKAMGRAVVVQRTAVLPHPAERVWAQTVPEAAEREKLKDISLHREDEILTATVQGRSDRLKLWSHRTRLESTGLVTVCTDQILLDAGPLNPLAGSAASVWLSSLQRRRERALREGSHAV